MKTNVLIVQMRDYVDIIAVSDNKEVLSAKLKEKVSNILTDMYGAREDLNPETDSYELDLWERLDSCSGKYWSDEDDECPIDECSIKVYIIEADKL